MSEYKYKAGDVVKIKEGAFGWDGSPDGEVVRIDYTGDSFYECCYDGCYLSFSYNCIDHEATEKLGNLEEAFNIHKRVIPDGSISNVNNPAHYNQSGDIECIDAIKATLGDNYQDYCKGNVMKYLWRYKYKGGLEDLKKAQWYLNSMIESVKE